jgi:plasmid stabilization system protein ParE
MRDTHRVIITAEALADLADLAGHIRQHSPQNAAAVARRILNAIDALASMPKRYKVVGRSRKHGTPIHSMVVRPFTVYYRVQSSPEAVYVLNVRHGSRRQPPRFK